MEASGGGVSLKDIRAMDWDDFVDWVREIVEPE